MMKSVSLLVLLFASVAFADLRFYVAENNAIRSGKADTQRFCLAVNEHPTSAYTAYAQFVFEQTTTAAIDWDFDGSADAYLKATSPIHTLALTGDSSNAKWDHKNFEKSGVFCGDVKSSHKLIKVILNIQSRDGGSMVKVDGSSFCEKAFKAIEPSTKPQNTGDQNGTQHVNFRPQAIFMLALGFVFIGFVLIALLRCCCVLVCRRRAGGCCKSQTQCCKATPAAPANAEEMQTLVYEEPAAPAPMTPFPAGGFVYVAPGAGAPMTPQFVQMAYPGQPIAYY